MLGDDPPTRVERMIGIPERSRMIRRQFTVPPGNLCPIQMAAKRPLSRDERHPGVDSHEIHEQQTPNAQRNLDRSRSADGSEALVLEMDGCDEVPERVVGPSGGFFLPMRLYVNNMSGLNRKKKQTCITKSRNSQIFSSSRFISYEYFQKMRY